MSEAAAGLRRGAGARFRRVAPSRAWAASAGALALGYWLASWLGEWLSTSPGYATPMWPASGIALGGLLLLGSRAWPALWLASFAANLDYSLGAEAGAARSLGLAALLGGATALQALLGVQLVRSSAGFPPEPGRERDVLLALLVCAPLSSALSGLFGPLLLWGFGVIPAAELTFHCWTWWLGDSMGALIFAPLVLLFAPGSGRSWRPYRLALALPLLGAFGLSTALFHHVDRIEQQRRADRFAERAHELARKLEGELSSHVQLLQSVAGLYAASDSIERSEFQIYSQHLLETYPGLRAIVWAPRVSAAERGAYEAAARRAGLADFAIREPGPDGELRLAGERAEYFPIHYAEPAQRNHAVLGFDLLSEPRRATALARARATQRAMASAPLELLRGGQRRGLMLALPVYRPAPAGSSAPAEQRLRGFAVVAFVLEELIDALGLRAELSELGLHVADAGSPAQEGPLFGELAPADGSALLWQSELALGGRRWKLAFHATPQYLAAQRGWRSWLVLAGVLVLSSTLGLLSLLLRRQRSRIELLVAARTAELARSNAELEQFAAVASHDLQDPLRRTAHSLARLAERCAGRLDGESDALLRSASESTQRMRALIQALLSYARTGSARGELVPCELERACAWALDNLSLAIAESGARITREPLPRVLGDESQLGQLLQNLLGNALKFRGEATPEVHVSARREGERWHIAVRDNGIGIDPDYQELIFGLFQRLNDDPRYPGTGVGLALCKKIAERHGSALAVESAPGKGATFHFALLAAPAGEPTSAAQTRSSPT
jgi:signal transduction histidine kinase